jgi:hypothetical protein
MPTATERRKAQRFPLQLPLQVRLPGPEAGGERGAAIRDISANGIYFQFDSKLEENSKVEFFVRLAIEGAPSGGVWLHCLGSIVRVEPTGASNIGVGARIDRYRFLPPGETPPGAATPHS